MKNFIFQKQWHWFAGGLSLGIMFFLAVLLVKPIGVSTQFVILDAIIWNSVSDEIIVKSPDVQNGYSSPNAYLNKSDGKYAKNASHPLNYSFIFVLAMAAGGFIAGRLQPRPQRTQATHVSPAVQRLLDAPSAKRLLMVSIGGILVLIGARLAGGCTSGHMMSGMMQTAVSGYLFACGAFAVAIPVALFIYRGKRQ